MRVCVRVCVGVGLKTVHGQSSPGRGIRVPTETNSTVLHRAAATCYLCSFAGLPRLEEHAGSARELCHVEAAGELWRGFLLLSQLRRRFLGTLAVRE